MPPLICICWPCFPLECSIRFTSSALRQSRAVLVLGVPFPGAKDRCVILKKKYNDRLRFKRTLSIYNLHFDARRLRISFARDANCRRCVTASVLDGNTWYKMQVLRSALPSCISSPPPTPLLPTPSLTFVSLLICFIRRFVLQIKRLAVAFGTRPTTAGAAAAAAAAAAAGNLMADAVWRSGTILEFLNLLSVYFLSTLASEPTTGARQHSRGILLSLACAHTPLSLRYLPKWIRGQMNKCNASDVRP